MKNLLTILLITLFAVSTASIAYPADNAMNGSTEYRIGPENVLVINVFYGRDREMERKVRVSSKGMINFPLLGEVRAAGLTINELENKLTRLLEKDYLVNPQVSVFIEEYSTVSVIGQVNAPGNFEIKGKLSVVEVISLAGGFTKIANTNAVKIIRTLPDGSKISIPVRVNDIINKGQEEDDVQLEPGDIVTVPESFF
ncbi:MAG: polysaccharide export protein [Candidatus Omnitrophica bacterium]|nr:polysaccharide export protein [Candidatus Omnitrophota bacterium]